MKLAMFCVAALSMVGCVDDVATGGGHQAGMRPAKPSIDNPTGTDTPATPSIFEGMSNTSRINLRAVGAAGVYAETIKPIAPLPGVCDDCQVVAAVIPNDDGASLGEINVFSDGGNLLCRIYFDQSTGDVVVDQCGWSRP